MRTFKKILFIVSSICVMQRLIMVGVEGGVLDDVNNSAAAYARSDEKTQGATSSILGSIYQKSRQLRCVTCYDDRRYGDDRSRYYSSYSARSGDDRASSWYYPGYDRYDGHGYRGSEYDRYGAPAGDRYGGDRYAGDRFGADRYGSADRYANYRDDRYSSRPSYDRYDSRPLIPYDRLPVYDRGESRGYGYDNRDRYYGSDRDYYGRVRYYDRQRYGDAAGVGSTSGYGAYGRDYYDRYSPRSQTGYYYEKPQDDRRYLPDAGYSSPCSIRRPNCPYNLPEEGTRVTSGTIDSGHYNVGVSQTNYHSNWNAHHNDSSKGSGSTRGWSYMREDEQPSRDGSSSDSLASKDISNHRDRNSAQQSSGYGALLDRATNLIAVEPLKSNENGIDTQKDASADQISKQIDKEQDS